MMKRLLVTIFILLLPAYSFAVIPTTTGWFQIPNTILNNVCAGSNGFPAALGSSSTLCNGVTGAWDGGTFDTPRNRLIIWGGGHNDYQGNEVYALDLGTLTMMRLNNPDTPQDCTEPVNGRPTSRHSASTLTYLSWLNALFNHGGSWDCSNGGNIFTAWRLNLATLTQPCNVATTVCPSGQGTWTQRATQDPGDSATNAVAVADPVQQVVYSRGPLKLYRFNDTANTWTLVQANGPGMSSGHAVSAAFDPVRNRIYYVGAGIDNGQIQYADVTGAPSTVTYTSVATTGCGALTAAAAPGWSFNTFRNKFMGWVGGNDIIIFDPANNTCTTETYTGGPGAQVATGTFGRFQFAPAMNLAVVCNNAGNNCYSIRIDAGTGDATPPTVSITAPTAGDTVSGAAVTLTATAADNVGVVGVQFKVDGVATGTEDLTAPYSISWNSTSVLNGSHTITATARDAAGNSTTSTGVAVTASNAVVTSDFPTRCKAFGVLFCNGFDTNADLGGDGWGSARGRMPTNGTQFCASDPSLCPTIDTTDKVSGAGSLKFTIPPGSGGGSAGAYWANPAADFSIRFGANQTYYVQFRQKVTATYFPSILVDNGKIHWVSTRPDLPGCNTSDTTLCFSSCTENELVNQNLYGIAAQSFPRWYTGCPGPQTFSLDEPVTPGSFKLQNARTGVGCLYDNVAAGNIFPPKGNCFPYYPDQWVTYSYKIALGSLGTGPTGGKCYDDSNPYTLNLPSCYYGGQILMRMGLDGQPLEDVINWTGPVIAKYMTDPTELKYGKVYFSPYTGVATLSTGAAMWFDELIISTQPIADPSATPDTTIPTVAITSPIPPTTSSTTSPIAVSGTATDNVGVTSVTWTCIACVTKGGTATSSPGTSISWSIPALDFVGAGSYTVNVVAHDAAGNVSTAASLIIAYAPSSTYWVRLTGTMSGCTPSTSAPATDAGYKSTIAAGIGCLAGGNTLNVRAGTYDVSIDTDVTDIPSGSPSNPTRIVSFDGPRLAILRSIATRGAVDRYVRFDGFKTNGATLNDQAAIVYNTSNFVTHTNFEIDGSLLAACTGSTPAGGCGEGLGAFGDNNTYSNGEIHNIHVKENDGGGNSGHGIYLHNSNNVVDNLYVHDVGGQGIQVYNSGSSSESNNTVKNSRWTNTKQSSGLGLSAIYLGNGTGNVAYNNIVYGNNYVGIQMGAACVNCAAYNNTVVGVTNQAFELYGGGQGTATAPILRNNLLSGNGATFVDNGATSPVHDHNGCAVAGTWCDIVGAINFFNPAANDYRLTSQSTMAINSGATTPYPNDITGLLRPQGSAFDLGAYESTVVTGPPPVVTIVNPTSNATLSVGLPLFSFGGTSNLQ